MTIDTGAEGQDLNQRVSENAATLLFRMGWKQSDLCRKAGITANTLSRKMRGKNDWSVRETQAIAAATYVELPELLGELPSFDVWRARRYSKPQPSDP